MTLDADTRSSVSRESGSTSTKRQRSCRFRVTCRHMTHILPKQFHENRENSKNTLGQIEKQGDFMANRPRNGMT